MGDALFELERILRSSKYKINRDEEAAIGNCKANAIRDFSIGASVAAGIVWTATRRLGYGYRINLSGGAAFLAGMWRFNRSLDSCIDNILAMEGSRMQKELANLILTKHRDNPWRIRLLTKHFYLEKVFDDSSSDQPNFRWRHRNFYGDTLAQSLRSYDSDTHDENVDLEAKKYTVPKQFSMGLGFEVSADPLECVFGYPVTSVEIHHPDTTGVSTKRRIRSHKRSQRRHRSRSTEQKHGLYDSE